jgi:hypothetical protein
MMIREGIASDTIFLLVFIGIVTLASLLIFWKWAEIAPQQASENSCKLKQHSFCIDWRSNNYNILDKPNWSDFPPKGTDCAKYGIVEPTVSECKKIVGE